MADRPARHEAIFATFNVRHAVPQGREHTQFVVPSRDHRALASAVAALGASVVAMQEVDRGVVRSWWCDQPTRCARAMGGRALFGPARRIGPGGGYGNALVVRGGVRRWENVALRSAGEPRAALFARVEIPAPRRGGPSAVPGEPLSATVVATHLQNRRKGRPDEAADQLREVLDRLADWPEPWVLMGDLNLGPKVVEPLLASAGLVPAETGPTHPADEPHKRIDWVAVRGLEVLEARVPDVQVSDHRPIVARLATVTP